MPCWSAKRFTKHEAIRRQMQYIGRLMREIDAGADRRAARANARAQQAAHRPFPRGREMAHGDPRRSRGRLAGSCEEFPEADPERLRELAETARKEQAASKPPPKLPRALPRAQRDRAGPRAQATMSESHDACASGSWLDERSRLAGRLSRRRHSRARALAHGGARQSRSTFERRLVPDERGAIEATLQGTRGREAAATW